MTTTVPSIVTNQGTELLDCIFANNREKFQFILNTRLKKSDKILKFCTTEVRHKTRREGFIPAELAVKSGCSTIVRYMLSNGLSPNHGAIHKGKFSSGSLLLSSIINGAVNTADVLLEAGADPNMRDAVGEIPLHVAVRKLNSSLVRLLLSRGADPCLPDRLGDPPLHAATHSGHLMIVSSLLKHNADVYQKGRNGSIAPHIAAREGHAHILDVFCKNSALCCDINVCVPCCGDGRSKAPIHLAAEKGHHESLSVLVEDYNADVHVVDSDQNTPLHYLVIKPYNSRRMREREAFVKSASILLEGGANANAKNRFGDTCLHLAVMNGYQSVVQVLLEAGADPTIANKQHLTPSDVVFSTDSVTKQALRNAKKKCMALRTATNLGAMKGFEQEGVVNPFNPGTWRMNQTMDIDDEFMLGPSVSGLPTPESSLVSERRTHARSTDRGSTTSRRNKASRKRSKSVDGNLSKTSRSVDPGSHLMIDHLGNGEQIMRDVRSGQVYYPISVGQESDQTSRVSRSSARSKKSYKDEHYATVARKSERRKTRHLERSAAIDQETDEISRGRYLDSSLSQVSSQVSPQYTNESALDNIFDYNNAHAYAEIVEPEDKTGTGHVVSAHRKPSEQQQGDSVKVSMIPGRPGSLEVEYGGKTVEISVNQEEQRPVVSRPSVETTGLRKKPPPATLPKPSIPDGVRNTIVHKAQVHAVDPVTQLANVLNGQLLPGGGARTRSNRAPLAQQETSSTSSSSETEDSEPETVIPAHQSSADSHPIIKIGMRGQNYYENSRSTFI